MVPLLLLPVTGFIELGINCSPCTGVPRALTALYNVTRLSASSNGVTIWVQCDAPELEKRCRPHLKATTDSWRVDETYVKVKKVWMYLYRAVDSQGNTLEFLLSPTRDAEAAKRFFSKTLGAPTPYLLGSSLSIKMPPIQKPSSRSCKRKRPSQTPVNLRQVKYLNNIVEQDHRFIKRLVKPGVWFSLLMTQRVSLP